MTTALTILILVVPFAAPAALSWVAYRCGSLRFGTSGRLLSRRCDAHRIEPDLDTIRARFEQRPVWPASGASGERR